jgi:hypothetical protein
MLITPSAHEQAGQLWADASEHWVSSDAEKVIQVRICAGLVGGVPTCDVRSEHDLATGRLDIVISEYDPLDRSKITWHSVLELKVLKSRRSTGTHVGDAENKRWIRSGVEQAASYRMELGAATSALCCFDMRIDNTGQECFDHVAEVASKNHVLLRIWFIYTSAEQYRRALVGS